MSFYDHVNRMRVEHSKRLLSETDEKIEAVAELSGFNSVMTFRRAFRAYTGLTPGEWRADAKGGGIGL